MKRDYIGRCHCGRVQFEVSADLEGERNAICNCSRCTMTGFIHHHVDKSKFRLTTSFDDLKLYKFGTLSAEHYFCKTCGVEAFYRSRSDPNLWDINVRCLKPAKSPEKDEKFGIYRLEYQLGDGANWEESQAVRHQISDLEEANPGYKHEPGRWHLLARAGDGPADLDVATEFEKTWKAFKPPAGLKPPLKS